MERNNIWERFATWDPWSCRRPSKRTPTLFGLELNGMTRAEVVTAATIWAKNTLIPGRLLYLCFGAL